jgi:hypothetical protein
MSVTILDLSRCNRLRLETGLAGQTVFAGVGVTGNRFIVLAIDRMIEVFGLRSEIRGITNQRPHRRVEGFQRLSIFCTQNVDAPKKILRLDGVDPAATNLKTDSALRDDIALAPFRKSLWFLLVLVLSIAKPVCRPCQHDAPGQSGRLLPGWRAWQGRSATVQ